MFRYLKSNQYIWLAFLQLEPTHLQGLTVLLMHDVQGLLWWLQ